MNAAPALLIISHDIVGSRMAGPGIRLWEIARVLARHLPVVLAVPGRSDLPETTDVCIWPYDVDTWESLAPAGRQARAILLSGDVLARFPALEEARIPLIVDGYDPHTFETLALFADSPQQAPLHRARERILQLQCRAGDFFLCASERQRDWWLGLLEAAGRINVYTYTQDPSLRRLLDVVPYGLRSSTPIHTRSVLKGVVPGLAADDKVVLWGGGVWQWLDPLTAIRAMAQVREQRSDVRLVFPGTRHPNAAAIPEMPVAQAAVDLAQTLGLLNQCVFFGDWAPFEDWPNYLLESDVALSLHLDTIETRLAFRSRLLDYVWAGLPMAVTVGDATSELVERYGLGQTVGYGATQQVSRAILDLLEAPSSSWKAGFARARKDLTWERAAQPLLAFCQNPQPAADKTHGCAQVSDQEQPAEELAGLRALVRAYESGRFIRFARWLHGLRHKE
jgi:glycosyltransferase involved in cell wall biosynthesis